MGKLGQFIIGTCPLGTKNPGILPNGNRRYYDKRCRARILMGGMVRGKIAKNSIFRVRRGYIAPDYIQPAVFQDHMRYYGNIGAPGSDLEQRQIIFRQAMTEVAALTPAQREPYKVLAQKNYEERNRQPGSYKARVWVSYYLMERLPQLWP